MKRALKKFYRQNIDRERFNAFKHVNKELFWITNNSVDVSPNWGGKSYPTWCSVKCVLNLYVVWNPQSCRSSLPQHFSSSAIVLIVQNSDLGKITPLIEKLSNFI